MIALTALQNGGSTHRPGDAIAHRDRDRHGDRCALLRKRDRVGDATGGTPDASCPDADDGLRLNTLSARSRAHPTGPTRAAIEPIEFTPRSRRALKTLSQCGARNLSSTTQPSGRCFTQMTRACSVVSLPGSCRTRSTHTSPIGSAVEHDTKDADAHVEHEPAAPGGEIASTSACTANTCAVRRGSCASSSSKALAGSVLVGRTMTVSYGAVPLGGKCNGWAAARPVSPWPGPRIVAIAAFTSSPRQPGRAAVDELDHGVHLSRHL